MDIVQVTVTLTPHNCTDDFKNRMFTLTPNAPVMKIGRSSKSRHPNRAAPEWGNASFTSPVVSRNHAELIMDANQKILTIQDVGSMHGTLINGISLHRNLPHQLRQGDRITLGNTIVQGPTFYNAREFSIEWLWHTYNPSSPTDVESRDVAAPVPHNVVSISHASDHGPESNSVFTVPESDSEDDSSYESPNSEDGDSEESVVSLDDEYDDDDGDNMDEESVVKLNQIDFKSAPLPGSVATSPIDVDMQLEANIVDLVSEDESYMNTLQQNRSKNCSAQSERQTSHTNLWEQGPRNACLKTNQDNVANFNCATVESVPSDDDDSNDENVKEAFVKTSKNTMKKVTDLALPSNPLTRLAQGHTTDLTSTTPSYPQITAISNPSVINDPGDAVVKGLEAELISTKVPEQGAMNIIVPESGKEASNHISEPETTDLPPAIVESVKQAQSENNEADRTELFRKESFEPASKPNINGQTFDLVSSSAVTTNASLAGCTSNSSESIQFMTRDIPNPAIKLSPLPFTRNLPQYTSDIQRIHPYYSHESCSTSQLSPSVSNKCSITADYSRDPFRSKSATSANHADRHAYPEILKSRMYWPNTMFSRMTYPPQAPDYSPLPYITSLPASNVSLAPHEPHFSRILPSPSIFSASAPMMSESLCCGTPKSPKAFNSADSVMHCDSAQNFLTETQSTPNDRKRKYNETTQSSDDNKPFHSPAVTQTPSDVLTDFHHVVTPKLVSGMQVSEIPSQQNTSDQDIVSGQQKLELPSPNPTQAVGGFVLETEHASTIAAASQEPSTKKPRISSATPFLFGALAGGLGVLGALIALPDSLF